MAFWGIELKPGKPYVHKYETRDGRLHLSQATLGGSGTSNKKTILQCVVGDSKPINLCTLTPDKVENCVMNHEFEEDKEVTFTTIGPNSVHLSGFFFGPEFSDSDDCEGEDIGSDSESDDIDYDQEEEEDEDDFIDDDDLNMYSSSPVPKSGVTIEEILDDEEEPTKENPSSKKSKKKLIKDNSGKQLVVRGTSGAPVLESEDDDGFPISSPVKSPAATKESHQKKENDAADKNLKRKNVVDKNDETLRETVDVTPGNDSKKKKRNKKKKMDGKDGAAAELNGIGGTSKEADPAPIEESPVAELENTSKSATKESKKNKKKKDEKVDGESREDASIRAYIESRNKIREFPNGLVIEDLAMGKPDGKKADNGKKVSVHYIGKLHKNGKIFDSNIGKAPFKFRLGIGQVIKGWDIGINGMRVGDKRRLTIPPSMGYGAEGAKGAIPPNAWLVFDVELVNANP